jgi:NAD(P)-dependent dehydrogenase (short-subunit alcohol dehydrogenase family)
MMADAISIFDLSSEKAVVLGGTGALGSSLAKGLANVGAQVAILGRSEARGKAVEREIRESSGTASFFPVDARNADSLKRARDLVDQAFGSVSILVNAAGGNHPDATLAPGADLCKLPLSAWNEVFDLNLVAGTLLPCQVFGQSMLERKRGSIINVASLSGITPLSRVVAYSAAKAAVINLTRFLAREWAASGIRVNCISPGFFPAEQNRTLLVHEDGSHTERGRQIIDHTPLSRFGRPDELVGTVVWLAASKASSFVTGQNIIVDGGFSAYSL